MSPVRLFLIAAFTFGFANLGTAQSVPIEIDHDETAGQLEWPTWIKGVWKSESVETTYNGSPSAKKFGHAKYRVFTSHYQICIYGENYTTVKRVIGQSKQADSLHCLSKADNDRPAIRSTFTQRSDHLENISYLAIDASPGRYRFKNRLTRVADQENVVALMRASAKKHIYAPDVNDAKRVIYEWIETQTQPEAERTAGNAAK